MIAVRQACFGYSGARVAIDPTAAAHAALGMGRDGYPRILAWLQAHAAGNARPTGCRA
jgi:hypothetical protein